MPKRSNQFQRLIAIVHHALAEDATVEESRELRDRVTGQSREVDIVIESLVGDYSVFVSIECSHRSRPATVEWVEQQHAKHQNLPTNKLILVSRSGFTVEAAAKATLCGIDALTLVDAASVPWTTVVHKVQRVVLDATSVVMMLCPCLNPRPKDPSCRPLSFDDVLISPEARWEVTVSQFADTLLNQPQIKSRLIESIEAGQDAGWIVSYPVAAGSCTVAAANGVRHDLTGLGLVVLAKRRIIPMNLRTAEFRDHQLAYGEASTDVGNILLAVLEGEGARPKAVLLRELNRVSEIQPVPGREIAHSDLAPPEAMAALLGQFDAT